MERKILIGTPELQNKIHLGSISNGRAAIISQGDIAAHNLVPCLAQQTGLVSSQSHALSLLTAGGVVTVPMSQQSQIFSQMTPHSAAKETVITERIPVLPLRETVLSQTLTVIPEKDPVFPPTFLKVTGKLPVMSQAVPQQSQKTPILSQPEPAASQETVPVSRKPFNPALLNQIPQNLGMTITKCESLAPVVKTELPEKYNFHNQVFLNQLQSFYDQEEHSDTIVVCENGTRRIHSLVIGAASSMIKQVFQDVAVRGFDCQFKVLMPETTVEELDMQLKPVYGFSHAVPSDSENKVNNFKIDFNINDRTKEKKQAQMPLLGDLDSVSDTFDSLALLFANNENSSPSKRGRPPKESQYIYNHNDDLDSFEPLVDNCEEELFETSTKKRKRGRPPKKIKTELEDEDFVLEPKVFLKEEPNPDDEFGDVKREKMRWAGGESTYEQDSNGLFVCQFSGCSFSTFVKASVLQHAKHSHSTDGGFQESNLSCARCGETWSNQDHYTKHLLSEICLGKGERPYICENCGQGWFNLTNYTKHIQILASKDAIDPATRDNLEKQNLLCTKSYATREHSCTYCTFTFFSSKNRDTHLKKAHSVGTSYKCAKCELTFAVHKEFSKHRKTVHGSDTPKKNFSCRIPNCSFDCDKRELLAGHVKSDHPENDHICIDCGKNFSDNSKLLTHMAGKKCTPVNYDCPHCPRQFNRKRHMELHVLFKHSQDRPFSCEECGKRFKTRHCVNIHLRSHGIGGFSWCCEECGKTFNQISAYHVHLKVHSNVRDFACETCGMTFKLKHSLKKHQLVHKSEFGHTCDFCGKKFKGGSYLDLTFGGGNHSLHLLDTCNCHVLGLDRDPAANSAIEKVHSSYPTRFYPQIGKFSELPQIFQSDQFPPLPLRGIILDLGVSELQLENGDRGFNFDKNGPLDLRMDPSTDVTASKVLQHADSEALARIFKLYGRVKKAKQVASDVVESRYMMKKINTTRDLKKLLKASHANMEFFGTEGPEEVDRNCVKVFESLRRFVNDEINQLEFAITFAGRLLQPGSTLVVITRSGVEEKVMQRAAFREIQPAMAGNPQKEAFMWTIDDTQFLGQENAILHVLRKVTK